MSSIQTEGSYCYILLLGSNLGDTEHNIRKAINLMEGTVGHVFKEGSVCKTDPVGEGVSGIFSNQAVAIRTNLGPEELLDELESIERSLGRSKPEVTPDWDSENRVFSDRVIDIDIMCADFDGGNDYTGRYNSERLCIPHKAIRHRKFVYDMLLDFFNSYGWEPDVFNIPVQPHCKG